MIDGGLISYVPSPGSLSGFHSAALANPLTINDASLHTLASLTFVANGVQKVRVSYTVNFKVAGNVPAGLGCNVSEGATVVVPAGGNGGGGFINGQTSIQQAWSYSEVLVPAIGSHTYALICAAAIQMDTFTVFNATLMVEIFN